MEYLTIKETARLLRVCTRSIFRYIKDGKIQSVKIGGSEKKTGKILISKSEIEKLTQKNR